MKADAVLSQSKADGGVDRFVYLDGLRGIAALCVVVYHYSQHTDFPVLHQASAAVDLFFCLSGFVLAHSYGQRILDGLSFVEYFAKRIVRLYPLFIAGVMIGLVALVIKTKLGMTDYTYPQVIFSFVYNALYIPYLNFNTIAVFGQALRGEIFPLNPPAWSLFFEMFVSAVFYAAVFASFRNKVILVGLSFLALVVLAFVGGPPGWGTVNMVGGFPRVTCSFFAGVIIYQYGAQAPWVARFRRAVGKAGSTLGVLIAAAIILLFAWPNDNRIFQVAVLLPLTGCVFIGSMIGTGGRIARVLTFLGDMSYPMYCLHYPLMSLTEAVSVAAHLNLSNGLVGVVSLALTLGFSLGLLLFFDIPVRRWLTRQVGRYHAHLVQARAARRSQPFDVPDDALPLETR